MNKYSVKIPYSYTQYGYLYGHVFAENEEEASDLSQDRWNLHDEESDDRDAGDCDYDYSESEVELEESGVDSRNIPPRNNTPFILSEDPDLPNHYLEDLPSLAAL